MSNVLKRFIGHHGTSSYVAKKIRKNKFKPSNWGWLGSGIYLECVITAEEKSILDISDPKSELTRQVNAFREEFLKSGINKDKIINMEDENFDGKLLDMICKEDCYVIVRNFTHTNTKQDRINKKKRSNIANGVELCAKINECITIR